MTPQESFGSQHHTFNGTMPDDGFLCVSRATGNETARHW